MKRQQNKDKQSATVNVECIQTYGKLTLNRYRLKFTPT